MPENNTATPLPEPNAGGTDPNLSVVPAPEAAKPTRGEFNKDVETELSKASEICTAAQKPEYAGPLETRGVDAPFVTALVNLILACGQKSQQAVACDNAREGATQSEAAAAEKLVSSLQTIQGAARLQFLPDAPARVQNYLVGQPLDQSRPLLERNAQALIDKTNEERPGGLDTGFIQNATSQRTAYVNTGAAQGAEESKAQQDRAQRDALLKEIIAKRKKIQYAADTLWPSKKPESVQARKDFKLPANRPYSY